MRQAEEVSEQGGFRWFAFAVLAAILIGSLVRLSLAPAKIERLVRARIEASDVRDNLIFGSAEVSLANGWIPELALVLNRVEWREPNTCSDTSPIRARLVRVPVRLSSLMRGQVAAGRLKIDDLSLDLDDLKDGCRRAGSGKASNSFFSESSLASVVAAKSEAPLSKSDVVRAGEIWTEESQAKIASVVGGIGISRGEIFFENRMKSVVLEDFSATWRGGALDVSTSLRFPPATVFGESLPNFTIRGSIRRTEIIADIRAELSEGTLEANSVLKPIVLKDGSKELNADLALSVRNLPLSVVTPLLTKSEIVNGAFRPKFIWLDCAARVHGVFSRLFVDNPVALSQCEVSGQVGRVSLQTAIRMPDGKWKPFEVNAQKVEIARVLETFEIQGPTGVFANFGQISGKLQLNSPTSAEVAGQISGAVIRFAGGEGTALQPISVGQVAAKLKDGRWALQVSQFEPEGGTADLTVSAEASGRNASLDVDLKHLKFSPRVEKAIFSGTVRSISGLTGMNLNFENPEKLVLSKFNAAFNLDAMEGAEIAAGQIKIEAMLAKGTEPEIVVTAKSAQVEVLKSGRLYRLIQPSLLGWGGEVAKDGTRLILGKVAVKGRFRDDGFEWKQAQASIGRSLQLSSHGLISRDHAIDAELEAQYPMAHHLKWSLQGTWLQPKFAGASSELSSLFAKAGLPRDTVTGVVPHRLLGLPVDTTDPAANSKK